MSQHSTQDRGPTSASLQRSPSDQPRQQSTQRKQAGAGSSSPGKQGGQQQQDAMPRKQPGANTRQSGNFAHTQTGKAGHGSQQR